MLVGLPPKLGSGGTPGNPAESGKVLGRVGRTLTRDRLAQRRIGREQVHVGKGRALVEHLARPAELDRAPCASFALESEFGHCCHSLLGSATACRPGKVGL